jgi:hypothetical protein
MIRLGPCAIILLAVAGCGEGAAKARLSGNVKWNGAPLSEGKIFFEGAGKKEMADIRNGNYEMALAPGTYVVRITSERIVPDKKEVMDMPPVEQIIPKKYNTESDLKVILDKSKEENFDLTGP